MASENLLFAMLGSTALLPVEQLINTAIDFDPHTRRRVEQFSGKELAIEVRSLGSGFDMGDNAISLSVQFQPGRLALTMLSPQTRAAAPTAKISGSAITLAALLFADPDSQPLARKDIEIRGDANFVIELMRLLRELDLAWDDLLAPVMGSAATQTLRDLAQQAEARSRDFADNASASIDDFIREEIRLLPTHQALNEFSSRLDALRLRIDRAEARTRILQEGSGD